MTTHQNWFFVIFIFKFIFITKFYIYSWDSFYCLRDNWNHLKTPAYYWMVRSHEIDLVHEHSLNNWIYRNWAVLQSTMFVLPIPKKVDFQCNSNRAIINLDHFVEPTLDTLNTLYWYHRYQQYFRSKYDGHRPKKIISIWASIRKYAKKHIISFDEKKLTPKYKMGSLKLEYWWK